MVSNVTSLTGNGLKDWLIQRMTAIFFAAYVLIFPVYFANHPNLDYLEWTALFNCRLFQIASILALFSLSLHSWIGIWTVTTDYLKSTSLRLTVQMLVAIWLLGQLIWGFNIVWGQ